MGTRNIKREAENNGFIKEMVGYNDELLEFEKAIDKIAPPFEAYRYGQEHQHYGEWNRQQTEAYNLCVRKCRENLRKLLREGTLVYSNGII